MDLLFTINKYNKKNFIHLRFFQTFFYLSIINFDFDFKIYASLLFRDILLSLLN